MFLDRLRSFLHEPPPQVLPPPVIVERASPPAPRKLSFVEELARSRPLPIKTLQPADVAIKFVRWWLQKRQHDFPMLPDDLYDLQITWATSVGVRPLKRDPLLEQLRSLPHVKKDRANVLNDFDHSFIFDRMQKRGKMVQRPIVYYIYPEKSAEIPVCGTTVSRVVDACQTAGTNVQPFVPRQRPKCKRGPKKKRKTSYRRAA